MSTAGATRERVIYAGQYVTVGQFISPVNAPDFSDTGPIRYGPLIVFPRTGVEITYAGHTPVVTDPNTVMFYNQGQEYRRGPVSPAGDRCEWFAFDAALVYEAVRRFDSHASENECRLFAVMQGPSDASDYMRQRMVVEHLLSTSRLDTFYVEETMLAVLENVVARAYSATDGRVPRNDDTALVHAGLARDAQRIIAAGYHEALTLEGLARALYVSPFHLCRVFRQQTGTTLHRYLNQIRLRASLESVVEGGGEVTTIAMSLGYSSHSHFTSAFRKTFEMAPSTYQRVATGPHPGKNLIA